ncbi:MAG: prevent-host-death family protein [Bacillota bacterium]|nr:MAG: prevent-host-death family protein [Bacillota bacterium]
MMLNKHRRPSVMIVRPSSVIRSDYKAFSKLCHDTDDPIIVTNNGENDLVVMSHEAFCRREAWIRLQAKLASADKQISAGNLVEHDEVFNRLRERVHGKA